MTAHHTCTDTCKQDDYFHISMRVSFEDGVIIVYPTGKNDNIQIQKALDDLNTKELGIKKK